MIKMTLMWLIRAALRAALRAYERVKTRVVILACQLGAAHSARQAATTPPDRPSGSDLTPRRSRSVA